MNLNNFTFNKFVDLFFKNTGIKLGLHKKYLLVNRLDCKVGEDRKYKSFDEYYDALLEDKNGDETKEFINRLTTNFSFFFREDVHFEFLEYFLLNKISDSKYIRIWSAACSTGEEPYSIALKARSVIPNLNNLDFKILATDISTKVLKTAMDGKYVFEKANQKNSLDEYKKYYNEIEDDKIEFNADIKKLISFRHLNLLDVYPFKKLFDIVFLRNVLIYFEKNEKELILNKIYDYIKPGGYLIMGLSESLVGVKTDFKIIKYSIYKK